MLGRGVELAGGCERLGVQGPRSGTACRPRIVEAVYALLVAEHGRGYRRQIEDAVPETFGQGVDRVPRGADLVHRCLQWIDGDRA